MKKVLLLMVAALLISSVAMADHFGVYTDATGSSCVFTGAGYPLFTSSAAVIEKFSAGTTGCRFKVDFPGANDFLAFNTPYVPIGQLNHDLSLAYGQCLNGDVVLGSIIANLSQGVGNIIPAEGFTNIIYTDCNFGEINATGGSFYVGVVDPTGNCNLPNAVQPSTWGQVKALYR